MKYVAMTQEGAIPVAARVTDEKAKELTAGAWHYVTKSKYKAIRAETKRIREQRRKAAEKAKTQAPTVRPEVQILAMAVKRGLNTKLN